MIPAVASSQSTSDLSYALRNSLQLPVKVLTSSKANAAPHIDSFYLPVAIIKHPYHPDFSQLVDKIHLQCLLASYLPRE